MCCKAWEPFAISKHLCLPPPEIVKNPAILMNAQIESVRVMIESSVFSKQSCENENSE